MNAVMISINEKWCRLIVSEDKTIEVRKTMPNIEIPFKCYIYCTREDKHPKKLWHKKDNTGVDHIMNGKVIGEFDCERISYYLSVRTDTGVYMGYIPVSDGELQDMQMTMEEMVSYGKGKMLYGWHISNLYMYDKPKELNEFWFPQEKYCEKDLCGGCPKDQSMTEAGYYLFDCDCRRPLQRPPQSWCYVEYL